MSLLLAALSTLTIYAAGPELRTTPLAPPKSACPALDLFAALRHPDPACVPKALKNFDPNETDLEGDTALHAAVRLRHPTAIPFLLAKGADLNRTNHRRITPREMAAEYGFGRLEAYFAEAELESERLFLAVDEGNLAAVKNSVKRGASLGTRNSRQDTPLHRAAQSNLSEIAAFLVTSGAPIDARNYLGETPLHSAALRDFLPTMKVLLAAGANPSALNFRRETPADLASVREVPEVLALLQKHKAKRGSRADVSFSISGGEGESGQ